MGLLNFLKSKFQTKPSAEGQKSLNTKLAQQHLANDPQYRQLIQGVLGYQRKIATERAGVQYRHRVNFPWLYGTAGFQGAMREFDAPEMRRLSLNEIGEMARDYRANKVSMTPWMFVRTEDAKQKLWGPGQSMFNRDYKTMMDLQTKAQTQPSTSKQELNATALFNSISEQGYSFGEMQYMQTQDKDQVGNSNYVMVYPEKFWSTSGGKDVLAKGAIPGKFAIYDNLQFNMKLDMHGNRNGFWHYPFGSTGSQTARGVFFDIREVCWLTQGPRTYRKYGFGKTEAIQARTDLFLLSVDQETDYFTEGAIDKGILMLLGFQPHEVNAFRTYYQNEVQGNPGALSVYGAPGVDGDKMPDAKYIRMNQSFKDMQMMDRQKWSAQLQIAEHGLNETVLGLGPNRGAFAKDVVQNMIAFEKAIVPLLRSDEQAFNHQIVWPIFGPNISFVFNPIMSFDELERKAFTARGLYLDGLWTKSQAREFLGDPRDEADPLKDTYLDPAAQELPEIRLGFLLNKFERDGVLLKDEARSLMNLLFPDFALKDLPDGTGKVPRSTEEKRTASGDDPDNPFDDPPSIGDRKTLDDYYITMNKRYDDRATDD